MNPAYASQFTDVWRTMVTQELVKRYQTDGYIIVENVIDPETLTAVRRVTDEFVERSRRIGGSDAIYDLGPGHNSRRPVVRRLKNPTFQHTVYDALMRSPAIVDCVTPLLGNNVRFDHSKLNFKPTGGDATVEWHQDWAFYPHTNDDILAVGIMLEDCDLENGPLHVIPGTHTGPVFDHHHDGYFVGAIAPKALAPIVDGAVALAAPAGSITIHHVRIVHGSTENLTLRPRPLLLFSYAATDAWPLLDGGDLEEFDGRIIRGEPTLTPRQEALPVRIPLPRIEQSDSIFDDQHAVRGRSFANDRAAAAGQF
ncbi:MAG: phytanoyl-CoA dioxygenase family protein [Gammaproteobacteria bacterium]|nr:phytanoyl-CoA dioxygenase family protein [Gammaproteobacteria bacterium]MDH3464453.1 phytanoyl-CoA dioxygenase family protein [Gammaproteobacteria bacterium]